MNNFMNKVYRKNISVSECLTSIQMAKLKDAIGDCGFNKVWTSGHRIMMMEEGSGKPIYIYIYKTFESMNQLRRIVLWKKA